jgi:HEAT repeat protein
LEELVAALRDPAASVREQAIVALGQAGKETEFAIPAIVEFIQAGDRALDVECCSVLANIGVAAMPALRRLAVGDGREYRRKDSLRRAALACLIRAAQADPTLKALKELAIDPAPEIRAAAREALRKVEDESVEPGP